MALKGNLRDFSLTQLLNLINLAQKTGKLVIEGTGESVNIFFREGKLAYAEIGQEGSGLIGVLYQARKLTRPQYQLIQTRAGNMSDKELGLSLINASYLSQQEILFALKNHFVGVLNHLFTWMEGFFQFENNISPPDGKITLRIGLENIIIEGSRRAREWENLQDEIPSLEMALKFVDRPGANIQNIRLSRLEWQIVSYVNPKNSIRQIARVNNLQDVEIRRIVYGLLQAGLIEIIRPETPEQPRASTYQWPLTSTKNGKDAKEEQKSLIHRIINRIRAL